MFAEGSLDIGYALALLAGAGTVIAALFKLLISAKDEKHAAVLAERDRIQAELISVKKSYQEIAADAVKSAVETTNYYRAKEGKAPVILAPPVVSESHSPSTEAQRETAMIQTLRATVAKVRDMTGQSPRVEPPHAIELPKDVVARMPQAAVAIAAINEAAEKVSELKDVVVKPEK